MAESNILPLYRIGIGEVKDGFLIKASEFCKKRCTSEKCERYYQKVFNSSTGPHMCPYGFTTFVFKSGESKEIFTAFKLKNFYDVKKTKEKTGDLFNPVLNIEQINEIINNFTKIKKIKHDNVESSRFVKDILHEIRSFNAKILTNSEDLVFKMENASKKKKDTASLEIARSIAALSSLIASRFSAYDATVNPESLKIGNQYSIAIHKKFHKSRMCYLSEAKRRNIEIKLRGSSSKQINVYSTFDLLPFLLFDNAIKYSPAGKEILITFEETYTSAKVKIESFGPYVGREELDKLFQKSYRSTFAERTGIPGSGIGLFLAQIICELHNIRITVFSEETDHMEKSIPYGIFRVELDFSIV